MNLSKTILLILTICLMSCTNADDTASVQETDSGLLSSKFGIWEGVGQQPGISWTIKITLGPDEQLIEYPSLECGGFLTLLEETENALLFRETITFNSICADQGFIELIETSNNSLDYNYYFPNIDNEQGQLGATGQVTKTN